MDCLLGIDLGSTSLKAVVYNLDGSVVAKGSRPTQRFHPNPDHPEWAVWQPEQIWGDTAAAIREAVGGLDDPRRIQGLAVTGMGMDGVPVDGDGRWLYPFISWHDPRTAPQLAWWQEHVGAEKVFSIGGNPLWPINSALRILWMKEHEPEITNRDRQNAPKKIAHEINIITGGDIKEDHAHSHTHCPDHANDGIRPLFGFLAHHRHDKGH